MKFELKQLNNNIFVLTFDDQYDLAMHFLRWSEFAESTDDKIRGTHFKILDFIESYAKSHKNSFSYPSDWAGFNLSSRVFSQYPWDAIPDPNQYDAFMKKVVSFIYQVTAGDPFYLIGHVTGQDDIVDHEMAHAMYDRNTEYMKQAGILMNKIPEKNYLDLWNAIVDMGYPESVVRDEMQAYLSTGLIAVLRRAFMTHRIPKKTTKPFEALFKKYKEELLDD